MKTCFGLAANGIVSNRAAALYAASFIWFLCDVFRNIPMKRKRPRIWRSIEEITEETQNVKCECTDEKTVQKSLKEYMFVRKH